MSVKTIGIGIIGAGFMGHTYARTVATQVEGARLTAIAGGARAPRLAEEYGATFEQSVERLLSREDTHLVCVATPHALHGPQALAAIVAGKHVLVDKPMAVTVAECDALLEAARARDVCCEVTFSQRERVCNVETKRILDSRTLGRILHLHTTQVVPDGMKTTPSWQLEPENVGILLGHGIHNIDQIRWLTSREIFKVFARLRSADPNHSIDATSDLIVTLDDGTVCTMYCSFETPAPGIPRTGGATQVVCENGIIDSDWYGELRVSKARGPWEVVARQEPIDWAGKGFLDPVRTRTYAAIIQRMVDNIAAGRSTQSSGRDGRQAVAVALAAYESSRTGLEIVLPRD